MTKKEVNERRLNKAMEIYTNPEAGRRFWESVFEPMGPRFPSLISKDLITLIPDGCFEPENEKVHGKADVYKLVNKSVYTDGDVAELAIAAVPKTV